MSNIVVKDYETFSEVDIRKAGGYHYARHPSTIVLCLSYTVNGGRVRRWKPGQAYPYRGSGTIYVAHNAEFEINIWRYVCERLYGWPPCPPPEQWIDTALIARYNGYPGKLEETCPAMKLPYQKNMEGHRIMMKLSRPRKPSATNPDKRWTPETKPRDFQKLYEYCDDDTIAEQSILDTWGPLPKTAQQEWEYNIALNTRGFQVDVNLAQRVLDLKAYHLDTLDTQMEKITAGEIEKCTQNKRIAKFLDMESVAAEVLQYVERKDVTKKQWRVIQLKKDAGGTSTAKFESILAGETGHRLQGQFMPHGALQTGRYAGSQMQPHNIARPKIPQEQIDKAVRLLNGSRSIASCYKLLNKWDAPLMHILSSCVRPAIMAKEDHTIVVCDYSAVEAHILAWFANCSKMLKILRKGSALLYCDMGEYVFGGKVKKHENPFEYSVGKAIILGAGFGMSGYKFQLTCEGWGIDMDLDLATKGIKAYRQRFPEVPALWYALNDIVLRVVDTNEPEFFAKCMWSMKEYPRRRLVCRLPSGREVSYPEPIIRKIPAPWDTSKKIRQIHYMSQHSRTRKWVETPIYGAMFVENLCQGTAYDALAWSKGKLIRKGLPIILHVHDEIGAEVHKTKAKKAYTLMQKIMGTTPLWAEGLPLSASGYIAERYRKD